MSLAVSSLILRSTFSSRLTRVFYSSDVITPDNCGTKKPKAKKTKTPKGKFDDNYDDAPESYSEKEPLKKYKDNVNPKTGEYGGPAGPEPTR
jgi:hypothetical protein